MPKEYKHAYDPTVKPNSRPIDMVRERLGKTAKSHDARRKKTIPSLPVVRALSDRE